MRLYCLRDVADAAALKYGNKRAFDEDCERRREISRKRQRTIQSKKDARENELRRRLQEYNLPLRADSRLCDEYIEKGAHDIDEVVDMMREMDFFFRFTNYRDIYRELRRQENDYDRDELSSYAKEDALAEYRLNHRVDEDHVPPTLRRTYR